MHIDFFSPSQTESVADLLHDMSVHYNGANASSREAVRRNLLDNMLGPDSGVRLVIAEVDGRAVGMAAISLLYPAPKEQAQLFMKELYVASDRRSDGVGEALMRWIARYALAHRCVRFDWTVDTSNPRAMAFYETLGAMHVADKRYYRFAGDALARIASTAD